MSSTICSSNACGACGHTCDLPHATSSCAGGVCQIYECVAPWIRCNTDNADGCELNGSSDVMNCGACDNMCPAPAPNTGIPVCLNSTCDISCNPGYLSCMPASLAMCQETVWDFEDGTTEGFKLLSTPTFVESAELADLQWHDLSRLSDWRIITHRGSFDPENADNLFDMASLSPEPV